MIRKDKPIKEEAFIMITQDTFPQLLEYLGFTQRKSIFMKTIGAAMLVVEAALLVMGFMTKERSDGEYDGRNRPVYYPAIQRHGES